MEVRPLDAGDDAALEAWYTAYLAADTLGREHPMPWMLEEMRADLRTRRGGEEVRAFAGYDAGEVVAGGMVILPMRDNRELGMLRLWTRPDRRLRGHRSAMLDHLVAEAAAAGRTTLVAEANVPYDAPEDGAGHPDADFAYRRGWGFDLCDIVRVLPLPVPAERLDELAAEAAPHHTDYTLRRFKGPVPDDIVEEFGALVGSLMVEAPSGEVELETEVLDEQRIREDEARFEASGRTKYTTLAVAADGALAAYSELVLPRFDTRGALFQWGTLVHPDHRGHRLGMATKVANLRWAQAEIPDRDRIYTMNAEVNAHMIGINETLGFRPVERHVSLVHRLS